MWYAVFDAATGELRSVGTVLADPMPDGLSFVVCGEERPQGDWDSVGLRFVPRPPLSEEIPNG